MLVSAGFLVLSPGGNVAAAHGAVSSKSRKASESTHGLTAVLSGVIGRSVRAYWVKREKSGTVATVAGSGLRARFTGSGVTVATKSGSVGFRLVSVMQGSGSHAVGGVRPTMDANRVFYRHPGVQEMDVNGPGGIEQSFEVSRQQVGTGRALVLRLAVSGSLQAKLDKGGEGVTFVNSSGRVVLHYDQLMVRDAQGRRLRASMTLAGRDIEIRVDTRGAKFPIDVDPYINEGQPGGGYDVAVSGNTVAVCTTTIIDPDNEWEAGYIIKKGPSGWSDGQSVATLWSPQESYGGCSVAMSGSTVAIGESGEEFDGASGPEGGVLVYAKPKGGWSSKAPTAILTASDQGDAYPIEFGYSVAISGDTIVVGDPYAPTDGESPAKGGVYVFEKPAGGWTSETQTARL